MPRQPNGRSAIRVGKDRRYHSWVTLGVNPDGTLIRRHVSATTAREVAETADARRARTGRGGTPGKIETVGDWLSYWLANVVKPKRSYKTYQGYELIMRLHVVPRIGGWRLDGLRMRLEPEHVEAMYAELGATLAPSYVVQVHRVLRVALKAAVRRGKASRNVCDLFDPPTARKAHIPSLSVADTQAVVAAALVDDQAPRWLIALLLGMRQGEVLGLRWHRVDLEAGKLLVLRQAQRHTWQHGCEDPHACGARRHRFRPCRQPCARHQRPESCGKVCAPDCARHASICPQRWGGGIVEVDTKSDTGKQDGLPLVPVLVEMLRGWRERQIRERAELGRRWDPKGLVFTTVEGGPIDPRRDHTRWEQLLAAAGVEDHRLHAARHTAATLMVATGTDVTVVQEVLRHASVETARVYVDVASDMKRQAVERVAALLFDGALGDLLRTSTAPK